MFVITNGSGFVCITHDKIKIAKDKISATTFVDKEKAVNFLKNMSRSYKNIGYKVEELYDVEQKQNFDIDDYFNPEVMDCIKEKIKGIQTFFRNIEKQKEFAEIQLDLSEKKILDIQHAAEFYNLNASQGYSLYKMLHDERIKRRKYKDQLLIISFITEGGLNSIFDGTVLKRIEGMDGRAYKPRIIDELFKQERNV